MLVARLFVAVPLLAAVLAMLWLGPSWLWEAATFVAAVIALWEWGRLFGFAGRKAIVFVGLSSVFMILGRIIIDGNEQAASALFGTVCLFWVFVAPVLIVSERAWQKTAFCALGMILIFATWHSASILFDDVYTLAAALVIVCLTDSGAYLVGRQWGKTKMAPNISPGKTVEGLLGGVGLSLLLAYLIAPMFFYTQPITALVAAAFALAMLSVLGDLFESAIKRRFNAKDSGGVLGAHGGVLDRMDSMLPTLPFAALLSPWLT